MKTVSVLITVYNRESYLRETLESLLSSSLSDFEAIIVDDNSSDNSFPIAQEFASKDPRIQVHKNVKNLGDYANRNKAASFAKGRYLKYLDADDLIYRHSLETMVEAMEQHPDAALALSSNIIDPDHPYPHYYTCEKLYRAHFLGSSPLGVGPSAAIIRRECFEAVGGFSGRQFIGDSELWLRLAERWPVVSLPPALVWWRRHEGQQMRAELAKPEILNVRYELEAKMLRNTRHLSDSQKNRAMKYLSHLHARRLWSLALKGRKPKDAFPLARKSGLSVSDILHGLKRPNKNSGL
jgi:glycosyltransferase involved in cell wall biosynthesis